MEVSLKASFFHSTYQLFKINSTDLIQTGLQWKFVPITAMKFAVPLRLGSVYTCKSSLAHQKNNRWWQFYALLLFWIL